MKKKILFLAEDGEALTEKVRALLEAAPYELVPAKGPLPPLGVCSLVVVVLSDGVLADRSNEAWLEMASGKGFQILPVTADLDRFSFATLPFAFLKDLNAVGFEPGLGLPVAAAVRKQLGEEAPERLKEVFISYRRSDGQAIANELYELFWQHRYAAFLDKKQLEGGAKVQKELMAEISKRDFVLLVDTPDSRNSSWVRDEIVEAITQRVPVGVLKLAGSSDHPLLQDIPQVVWDAGDSLRHQKVLDLASRSIGERSKVDQICQDVVQIVAKSHGVVAQEKGRRLWVLRKGRSRFLLEWEKEAPSLERLHRLHQNRVSLRCRRGLLVCGDRQIDPLTHNAVAWAARGALQVAPITRLHSVLEDVFR